MSDLIKSVLLLVSLVSSEVYAQNLQDKFYTVRPKGMGGAFASIANDKNAVWFNPAGIARMRKSRSNRKLHIFSFPNVQANWNQNGLNYITAMASGGDDEGLSDILTGNDSSFGTENIFADVGAFPLIGFDMKKKGQAPIIIGFYGQSKISSVVDTADLSSSNTTAATQAMLEVGALFDIAYNNQSNLFSIGLQLRAAKRNDFEDVLSSEILLDKSQLMDSLKKYSNSTFGLALDAGMLWTFADLWFPTLAISIMDLPVSCKQKYLNPFSMTRQEVCGTVYQGDVKNEDSLAIVDPTNLMIGLSMTPRLTRNVGLRVALEMHNINLEVGEQNWGLSDIPLARKMHAGIELFFGNPLVPPPFSLTAGVNQGFLTYGINIKLGFVELGYAKYSENISTTSTTSEDERHIAELSFEF